MRHEYIGKVQSEGKQERQTKRDRLDAQWKQARIDAELARQKVHAAKLLEMKGELISKKHVTKQAAFLVLSLRARLLAIPAQHAGELLNISDEHEMQGKLDSIVRVTLETLADLPLKVSDEHWLERLDESEATPKKRKIASRAS